MLFDKPFIRCKVIFLFVCNSFYAKASFVMGLGNKIMNMLFWILCKQQRHEDGLTHLTEHFNNMWR